MIYGLIALGIIVAGLVLHFELSRRHEREMAEAEGHRRTLEKEEEIRLKELEIEEKRIEMDTKRWAILENVSNGARWMNDEGRSIEALRELLQDERFDRLMTA